MARRDLRLEKAQEAIDSIGLGFDITQDICFENIKRGPRLIRINEEQRRDLKIPGGISIPNVPNSIECLGGESYRIQSQILNYEKMSEHFNTAMRLTGKIPSGHFCASFGLSGNAAPTTDMSLAYDGWFFRRYAFELEQHDGASDHLKEAVPLGRDSQDLARFIERFGTHVVVAVSMGGKDVLYVRQDHDPSSSHEPARLLNFLKDKASKRFTDSAENHCLTSQVKENIAMIYNRRGGSGEMMRHSEWLDTIDSKPDVISLFLLPLPTFLSGKQGIGFLSHAINLYIRYKPPIEELHQFLEFMLPRHWAPVPGDTYFSSGWKSQGKTGIRMGIFGPMLHIDTTPVNVGNRPVTGLRLQLEGTRSNRLAIHLQHLDSLPKSFLLSDNIENGYLCCDSHGCNFHKKVKWNCFSYVCTAPIESDDSLSIVTGAQLLVERNCLRLRLRFSKVIGATLQKSPEWDQSCSLFPHRQVNSGSFIASFYKRDENEPKPGEVTVGSSTYSFARPSPVKTPKLERFIDKSEIVRGPIHSPGHWVVSGAGLYIQNGRMNLRVKYSLFNFLNNSTVISLP